MATAVDIIFRGNARGFQSASQTVRSELGHTERSSGRASGAFSRLRGTVGILAGVGGFLALASAARAVWGEMEEAAKVGAQTEAVIASTGGIANVTAQHVSDLAQQLLRVSGVDDEVIAGGANMLLTFTKVRNEVGKGNDIFDRATRAALDMSVALGTDMRGASLQIGKALQDPIRGLTALRRVGVSFTDAQENQIRAMVKTGDVAGAQKIILAELTTEFGGSAKAAGETLPGKLSIMRESLKNTGAEILTAMTPALQGLADILVQVAGFAQRHSTVTTVAVGAITAFAAAVWLMNFALAANPIVLVIGLLVALGVGLVVAWKKSETFRRIVSGAWTAVKDAALTAVSLVLLAISKYLTVIATVLHIAGKMPGPLGAPFRAMASAIDGAIDKVKGLRESVQSLRSKEIHVRAVVEGLGAVAALQEHLALIHAQGVSLGARNRQHGGPVSAGRPYIVGERRPELFIPNVPGRIMSRVPPGWGGGLIVNVKMYAPQFFGANQSTIYRDMARRIGPELNRVIAYDVTGR